MAQSIYELFHDYSTSIAADIPELLGGKKSGLGQTAGLFTGNIAGQCEIQGLLAIHSKERVCIEVAASQNGVTLLLNLLQSKRISYAG